MFNFCKYLFLFIMNLSLAVKIDTCSVFSEHGIYHLDKVIINGNEYKNIIIDITNTANQLYSHIDDDGTLIPYTLKGTIKYSENDESDFIYCADYIPKKESSFKQSVVLSAYHGEGKEELLISISDSTIIKQYVRLTALDDHATNMDNPSNSSTSELSEDYTHELLGQKRSIDDGADVNQIVKKQRNLAPLDTSGCSVLKPGKYNLSSLENFYIQIISSEYNGSFSVYKVEGFLIYDNFFSVPIIKCDSTDNDLIFSLSRGVKGTVKTRGKFIYSNLIKYKVPKNKFIDENYTNTKLSPSSNYFSSLYNIGCILLYRGNLKNKSTFRLKNNVIINITYRKIKEKQIPTMRTFNIKGNIKIDGKEYLFYGCDLNYDQSIYNNDSKIIYYEGLHNKDENSYLFNILDFLPPLTS